MDEPERPKVGIGVIVVKDGKVLIGKRLTKHANGTFAIPGGHLELGETFEETALREVAEETGLTDIELKGLVSVYNDNDYAKHYVSMVFLAEWKSGEPYNAEPEKLEDWQWVDPKHLPEPMFIASKKGIENWISGKIYTDFITPS